LPERNAAFEGGGGKAEVKRRRVKTPTGVVFRAARSLGRIAQAESRRGEGQGRPRLQASGV